MLPRLKLDLREGFYRAIMAGNSLIGTDVIPEMARADFYTYYHPTRFEQIIQVYPDLKIETDALIGKSTQFNMTFNDLFLLRNKLITKYRSETHPIYATRLRDIIEQISEKFRFELSRVYFHNALRIEKTEDLNSAIIKFKPFNWIMEFSDVFEKGGFDAVIGNPPYDVIYSGENPLDVKTFKTIYTTAEYNPNLFCLFVDRSLSLLNQKGLLGFIIPDTILTNKYFGNLRRKILSISSILQILDLSSGVFPEAIVDTIIFILKKEVIQDNEIFIGYNITSSEAIASRNFKSKKMFQKEFINSNNNEFNIYFDSGLEPLKNQIWLNSVKIEEIANIKRGLVTKDNSKFVYTDKTVDKCSDSSKLKRVLIGGDASRYLLHYSGNYVLFDASAKGGGCWDREIYENKEKILIALITGGMNYRINATYDSTKFYALQNYNVLIVTDSKFSTKYVLGIINSKLISNYYELFFNDKNIKRVQLLSLPIKVATDAEQQKIANLVDRLLSLMSDCNVEKHKTEIKKANEEIDECVYKLYGITETERKLIENNLA